MDEGKTTQTVIFDIQRFAVHDGPGIRTTVFFKGCPLSCVWCHNPESRASQPELLWSPEKCLDCARCRESCCRGVHQWVEGRHTLLRQRCIACGACASTCYAGALELAGRLMTVDDVLVEVMRDEPFYRRSGGGLTVSGGEPLAHYEFTHALLREARQQGLHTAVDTSGLCPWEYLEGLSPYVNLFLYDLKQMDAARHQELTGASNERILDNLRRLDAAGHRTWVRIPLIPGYNDDESNYLAMGPFLSSLEHVGRIEILSYHPLAESKYARLDSPYGLKGLRSPSRDLAESRRDILLRFNVAQVVLR